LKAATFRGGVHPAHHSKNQSKGLAIREFVTDIVQIPVNMHIGAPSNPCVQKGDHVKMGQMIAEPVGFLGVPVHASVSGEVIDVKPMPSLGENPAMSIIIKNDFKDEWVELNPLGDVETVDPSLIIPAIKNAGIVGMGGASFPTHVKLSIKPEQQCDYILANGAECETHLTCDHRLMLEEAERVVNGLRAVMRAVGCKTGIIGIEDNKPDAIEAMQKACEGREGVRVQVLATKYPQGGEKQLIEAITGRQVPTGGLPIGCGCIVVNVATCSAISDAITKGMPLVQRITTVTGCVRQPANLRVRIGTLADALIGECGGFTVEPGKIFSGGAMTGFCLPDTMQPITKAGGGIVVMSKEEALTGEESPCIRCGKCQEICPIGLKPLQLKVACDNEDFDKAKKLNLMDCTLCGSCSFICPARRHLTISFKIAKQKIAALARKGG